MTRTQWAVNFSGQGMTVVAGHCAIVGDDFPPSWPRLRVAIRDMIADCVDTAQKQATATPYFLRSVDRNTDSKSFAFAEDEV